MALCQIFYSHMKHESIFFFIYFTILWLLEQPWRQINIAIDFMQYYQLSYVSKRIMKRSVWDYGTGNKSFTESAWLSFIWHAYTCTLWTDGKH